MPSPLASSISRSADSRTWPTLPAGPSSSSTVIVWIESTTTSAGRLAARDLDDRADLARRKDADRVAGGPSSRGRAAPARRRTWAGRLLARGVEDAAAGAARCRRRPGAGASTSRLPGSPPIRSERAGDDAAAEDAVELADAGAAARAAGPRQAPTSGSGLAADRRSRAAPLRAPRAGARSRPSRRGCSRPRRSGTGPPSGGTSAPQAWQTNRLCGLGPSRA